MNKLGYTQDTDIYRSEGVYRHLTKEQVSEEFGDWSRTIQLYDDLESLLSGPDVYLELNTLEDVITFTNLPDKVTVYRGANKSEVTEGFGQSWTLDPDVAEFFAYKYYSTWSYADKPYFATANRCIYQAVVPKNKILVYTNNRKEYECILDAEYCKTELKPSQLG